MGARSRKRRRGTSEAASPAEAMSRGYARGRERDEAIRRSLEPLSPGERPRAVTVAAIVALCFAIANVVAALAGADLSSQDKNPATVTVVTTAILLIAATGMWLAKYWAVLGFQIILALQIIAGSLALIRVEKWWIAIGLTVLIGLLGWLFWKLVRAMARLQMPDPARQRPDRRQRDVLASRLASTESTWKTLHEHGVQDDAELPVEFVFVAPGEEQATALAAFLEEVTDYGVRVDGHDGWTVTGETSPMVVSRPMLKRWVRWMVAIGFEHGCELHGWGAEATRA
jgi:hypothetical protein